MSVVKREYERWVDRTAEGTALGLARQYSIVHAGWQIGPGGYAANGITTQAAAEPPTGYQRLYSTSAGVFAHTVTAGTLKIFKSADGIAAYSEVYSGGGGRMSPLLPLLIDCGSNRLLLVEYGTDVGVYPFSGNTSRIWASSDAGANWTVLFTTAAGAIRHFHGGLYDSTNTRLYLFTGDSYLNQDSILHCSDVADLFANPTTWKTRWGLDDATRSTLSASYCVGYGSDNYRVVGAIAKSDWIVTGQDVYWVDGGARLNKWHRTSLRMGTIPIAPHSAVATDGRGVGELWMFGLAQDGNILIGTQSWITDAVSKGDDCFHLYALEPNELTAREVLRIPAGGARLIASSIHTVGDYTVISGATSACTRVGRMEMKPSAGMSQVTLTPRTKSRGGVKSVTNLLLESGDALLLESGDNLLGEA